MGFNLLGNSLLDPISQFEGAVKIFEDNQGKSGLTEVVKTFKKVQDKYYTDLSTIAPHVESLNRCVELKSEYLARQNLVPSTVFGVKEFVKSKLGVSSIDDAHQILKNYSPEIIYYSQVQQLLKDHAEAKGLHTQLEIEEKLSSLGLDEDYIGLNLSAISLAADLKSTNS